MKKFIFFRTDRLGDFIIITNIIYALKKRYPNCKIIVVASQYNYDFIKQYKLVNKVILFNKNFNLFKKIGIFIEIIRNKYDVSFSVDGKSFSNLCTFFLNSKLKLGLIYKSTILGIPFYKPNIFFKMIFNYYETFTSKKHLSKIEHLPTKLINLANKLSFKIKSKDKYYYSSSIKDTYFKKKYGKNLKNKFILIHLDEKWVDILDIENNLFDEISTFQKKIKMKIIITSNNNFFDYYIKFKKQASLNRNIYIFENLNLMFFERLIANSLYSISCHSGFMVQISGCNQTNIIDIINKKDYLWYSCWKPLNTKHKFIFKSNLKKKITLKKIFLSIIKFKFNV